jgi:hypothetical protein
MQKAEAYLDYMSDRIALVLGIVADPIPTTTKAMSVCEIISESGSMGYVSLPLIV